MFLDVDHHVLFQPLGRGNYVPKQYHAAIRIVMENTRIIDQFGKWLLLEPPPGHFAQAIQTIEQDTARHFCARTLNTVVQNRCWAVLPFYLQTSKSLVGHTATLTLEIKAARVKRHGLLTYAQLVLQVSEIRNACV